MSMKYSNFNRYLDAHDRWFSLEIALWILSLICLVITLYMNVHDYSYILKAGFFIFLLSFPAGRVSSNMLTSAEGEVEVKLNKLTDELKELAKNLHSQLEQK